MSKISKQGKNEKKVEMDEPPKLSNTNQHHQPDDDLNIDNLSFCSDNTAEFLADVNEYLFEDEVMAENERLILSEPKFHKTLRPPTFRINLKRVIENNNLNAVIDPAYPSSVNNQIDLTDKKNKGFSQIIIDYYE